jgi:predicted Zn finger-like uncharacterized protein
LRTLSRKRRFGKISAFAMAKHRGIAVNCNEALEERLAMPVAMKCPSCQAQFRLADEMAGKKMKCKKCQQPFVVPQAELADAEGAPVLDMELDDKPAPAETALSTKPAPPPAKNPDEESAVEEDGGKKGPRKPPPLSKKSTPADRPTVKARRKPAASGSGGMTALLVVLLGGGLLACVGCTGFAGYFLFASGDRANPPAKPEPAPIAVRDNKVDIAKTDVPPPPPRKELPPPPPPPPKEPPAINVVFGADGVYRHAAFVTTADPLSQFGGHHKLYFARLEAEQTYQIDLAVRDIKLKDMSYDPYLYLLDDQKKVLAEDNDSGGEPNARIVFRPKSTGNYRILATHFGPLKNVGSYNLTVRQMEAAGKSLTANTHKLDGFEARELTLATSMTDKTAPLSGTEPCWDAQGKSSYWLTGNNGTLQRISRDGKIEAAAALPLPCHKLAVSAEGLLTLPINVSEVWLIDPETLAVRAKIPCAPKMRWLGAVPTSSTAVLLGPDLSFVDLKEQRVVPFQIIGGPGNLGVIKSVAVSPDGKYLCVQAMDYTCHRFRMEGIPLARATVFFQFTPDSKHVAMPHPSLTVVGAKKVSVTEVFPIDAWDKPAYTLPVYLKLAAFDGRGGLYAVADKEVRYYAEPSAPNAEFKTLMLPSRDPVRRVLAPPQGAGCLMLAQQQSFLVEPAAKN